MGLFVEFSMLIYHGLILK